ncbi:glycosyltransferase family 4 protein [Sphingobium fuliginis]|jgi:glycosyltransferase involved in cell wall biosynthesis|uniref:Glycosyltransferase family 4 protein n=1 Tax=Sphingobium fuliginis (strain ATCC 27551) TaxID=336203 RepID=A0A7M2GDG0_SPHSA|nr:glycosyltransferase family 1 protein [Sphingobium fuliginis]QOT70730.1 glycosyltransferase family 4 protein [Sphingobium fuliginis]
MTDNALSAIRIGLDGYNLAMPQGTGVATYGRNLAAAVAELGHSVDLVFGVNIPRKANNELLESLFFGQLGADSPGHLTMRRRMRRWRVHPFEHELIQIPVTGRTVSLEGTAQLPAFERLFNRAELYDLCARHFRRYGKFMTLNMLDPPAIMHWTYPLPVRLAGAHNIYTLHDLVPLRLPRASLEDKRYYDALVRTCVHEADQIVTVSEKSRTDIIDLLNANPEKVTNCYQTSDMPALRDPAALPNRLHQLFDLEMNGYFLFFGAIEPKKNLGRIIQAYLEADIATPLVIVGSEAWHADRELKLLGTAHGRKLPGVDRIRRIDYVPRTLLTDLVHGAKASLFPALYEGFGLPALEALAAGVPLLSSTTGALPEVTGDAALSVDPYDIDALVNAIRRLDRDAALRARLAERGPFQAAKFSRTAFADRIGQLYQKIIRR